MSRGDHDKALIRERLLLQRLRVPVEQRVEGSARASRHLLNLSCISSAGTIAFYAAVGSEADPALAIQACQAGGKRVVFPRMRGPGRVLEFAPGTLDELVTGPHRTREPPSLTPSIPADEIDCIVVPGVAFDAHGRRLGRGGGFYDATLATFPRRATRVGFALELQIVPFVPSEGHDIPMDVVVTDARVLHATAPAASSSASN